MTSLKDQYKLLKDAGKGVAEGAKKAVEPFLSESVFIPGAVKSVKKFFEGSKDGSKKIIKGDK